MPKNDRQEKGFILIIMLFLMVLLAVVAIALNSQTALSAKMAGNQGDAAQSYFGELAVIEQSLWKLAGDPSWRVPSGENYTYKGTTYTRKVFIPDANVYPALAAYSDAIIISVLPPNASRPINKSFRYHIDTPVQVRKPRQVSLDGAGNIFFADMDNHSVWRIDAVSGAITRVAGTGMSGFSGDGGPATQALLNSPRGVSIDQAGNIYISDTDNHRIRRVTAGIISTIAGTSGGGGYSGDGSAATAARLNSPYGIAADASGNIYIADRDNHRIRKVTAATGVITTIAGSSGGEGFSGDGGQATAAQLDSPRAVFVTTTGDIFIADTDNNRIRKVTVATGIINTVAGTSGGGYFSGDGGQATAAHLSRPRGIFISNPGDIFIADTDNNRIRKVTVATGIITTIAGTGAAGYGGDGGQAAAAQIDDPTGVWVKSSGVIILSDTSNSCLRQVDTANVISTSPQTVQRLELNDPTGIATYYDGAYKKLLVFIADRDNHRIRMFDTATNIMVQVAGTGAPGFSGDNNPALNAQFSNPEGIAAFYDTGQEKLFLYIADTGNHRIRKIDASSGIISTVAGTGVAEFTGDDGLAINAQLNTPRAVAVDNSQNIYIADTNNNRIRKVSAATGIITTFAGGGAGAGETNPDPTKWQLAAPRGVFTDSAGNVYIADTGKHKIRKVNAAGNPGSTIVGTGAPGYSGDGSLATAATLSSPNGVAVDGAGNIYIADTGNNVLRLVNIHDGTINTMAGTGTAGYNGDNQPAVNASLNGPAGVALGLTKAGGRIFISDSNNNRIRTLFLKTTPEVY